MTRQLYDEIQELKQLFEYNPSWFNDYERAFTVDSIQRFDEYGAKSFFTAKQENRVTVILNKIRHKAVKSM